MKITYDDKENALHINDGQKNVYLILKILMILNILNASIRLVQSKISEYSTMEYFWMVIGVLSFFVLLFFVFKTSTAQNIKLNDIRSFKEKMVLGKRSLTLQLKNGKNRSLGSFKNESEVTPIRELLTHLGISERT